jgi:hypothetical protein
VDAGRDQHAVPGVEVRLPGRGPLVDAGQARWRLIERPAGSAAALANAPDAAEARFVPDRPGTYRLRLAAVNGAADARDEVLVQVSPPGAFVLHDAGAGEIEDLLTGAPAWVPFDRRVHVVIAPEGFTDADLAAGRLEAEVERWRTEVLSVEPYASFRGALAIWSVPLASRTRVRPGVVADTALALRVAGDGWNFDGPSRRSAGKLWDVLRDFPVPLAFFGPGGRTGSLARNAVVVVPVLDPKTGRPGFSGATLAVADPARAGRQIAVAFALDRAHEFSHAFARLQDEYLDDRRAPPAGTNPELDARFLTNLAPRNDCDALPWRHLMAGSTINPGVQGLIGAFGTAQHGFHPELKCLMNGGHDNARHYGGDGRLRTGGRLCNFCREVTTFRLLERIGQLPDAPSAFVVWATRFRARFFARFGFDVPPQVPQANSDGQPIYQPCRGADEVDLQSQRADAERP